jgi:hypothetical protein
MDAQGRTGHIQWDGTAVTISRRSREIRVPVEQISAVEWRPAGALSKGWLRLVVPGTPLPRKQRRPAEMARLDPYAVTFSRAQQPAFEALRRALGK